MSRILIHAGNLKTGTTAIQAVLMRLRPKLAERGIVMPGLEAGDRAHYKLAAEIQFKRQTIGGPVSKRMIASLREIEPEQTALLTSETFINGSSREMRDIMVAAQKNDATVLFYVRPHASLIASLYLQHLKMGIFAESIEERFGSMNRLSAVKFIEKINRYSEVFGKDAVMVREFSKDRLVDKSIVADFWKAFQLPEDLFAQALATEEVRNPTPTQEVALLVRAIGLHMQAQKSSGWTKAGGQTLAMAFFRNLSGQSADLPGTQFRLPLAVQESIAATWEGPRAAFAERWFTEPPTATWLHEPLLAPPDPICLPYDQVEAALGRTIKRLKAAGLGAMVAPAKQFLKSLPMELEQGRTVIDIKGLQRRLGAGS